MLLLYTNGFPDSFPCKDFPHYLTPALLESCAAATFLATLQALLAHCHVDSINSSSRKLICPEEKETISYWDSKLNQFREELSMSCHWGVSVIAPFGSKEPLAQLSCTYLQLAVNLPAIPLAENVFSKGLFIHLKGPLHREIKKKQ